MRYDLWVDVECSLRTHQNPRLNRMELPVYCVKWVNLIHSFSTLSHSFHSIYTQINPRHFTNSTTQKRRKNPFSRYTYIWLSTNRHFSSHRREPHSNLYNFGWYIPFNEVTVVVVHCVWNHGRWNDRTGGKTTTKWIRTKINPKMKVEMSFRCTNFLIFSNGDCVAHEDSGDDDDTRCGLHFHRCRK